MSTILIVDDYDQLRKSFHRLLTEKDIGSSVQPPEKPHRIHTVPDLVVLDMKSFRARSPASKHLEMCAWSSPNCR